MTTFEDRLHDRYPFTRLVQRMTGIIDRVDSFVQEEDCPQFHIATTSVGNLTMAFANVANPDGTDVRNEPLGGAGVSSDPETAAMTSIAEGLERYCTCILRDDEVVVATACELGDEALDLTTLPRLSERELADPAVSMHPPNPDVPIRWVRGWSLTRERPVYVPAVLTHLYLRLYPGEGFAQQISTGVAAHTDVSAALASALLEVVERDAIALTWLCRPALARITFGGAVGGELGDALALLQESSLQQLFFDATTDLGVPTVYSLQIAPGHPRLAHTVACASGFDFAKLCAKTVRESTPYRRVLNMGEAFASDDVTEFKRLTDGALYLGRPEKRHEFDFLSDSPRRVAFDDLPGGFPASPREQLALLIERFRALEMEAVVVDITTDDVRDSGLWVLRAIVPQLMPMSPVYRARFLGHPRLYDNGRRNVAPGFSERDVNPAPQPFA